MSLPLMPMSTAQSLVGFIASVPALLGILADGYTSESCFKAGATEGRGFPKWLQSKFGQSGAIFAIGLIMYVNFGLAAALVGGWVPTMVCGIWAAAKFWQTKKNLALYKVLTAKKK